MSEQPHIYLVRTPEELVHKSIVAMDGREIQAQADEKKITVIDGAGLVAWISDKLASLSDQTKSALGIIEVR